jgi:hypothetical protein
METGMTNGLVAIALCTAMLLSVCARADDSAEPAPMTCGAGPVERTYAETKWLVFSCDDGLSVVIVAAPGSPANPFVFRFLARGNAYVLQSRGSGDRAFTTPAYGELSQMTGTDIAELVRLTRARAGN